MKGIITFEERSGGNPLNVICIEIFVGERLVSVKCYVIL